MRILERVAGWCEAMVRLSNDLSPLSRRTESESKWTSSVMLRKGKGLVRARKVTKCMFRNLSGTAGYYSSSQSCI